MFHDTDKSSLLDQTFSQALQNPLFNQPWLWTLISGPAESSFSKNLAQLERIPHTEYLINLSSPIMCQVVSGHPGLSLKRILSGWFSQRPPCTADVLLLVIFHPLTHTMLHGYKFPCLIAVFRIKLNFSLLLWNSIAVVPLNKVCLMVVVCLSVFTTEEQINSLSATGSERGEDNHRS